MKYLIFAMATLLAGECAVAQTTAPAGPANKNVVKQPAPVTGAAAAKNVGTKDMTVQADAYAKAQEKKRAQAARKVAAKGGDPKAAKADDSAVRPATMMTDDERAAHRKKLQSFKTLAECETYDKQHQAEMQDRAKKQNKTLREPTGAACNRYKAATAKPGPK